MIKFPQCRQHFTNFTSLITQKSSSYYSTKSFVIKKDQKEVSFHQIIKTKFPLKKIHTLNIEFASSFMIFLIFLPSSLSSFISCFIQFFLSSGKINSSSFAMPRDLDKYTHFAECKGRRKFYNRLTLKSSVQAMCHYCEIPKMINFLFFPPHLPLSLSFFLNLYVGPLSFHFSSSFYFL